MQFLVAQYIDKAVEWALSGWFDIDRDIVRDRAYDFIDEAMRLIDEKVDPADAEFLTHSDVALVAVALAVESVAEDIVLDWFADDVVRFITREARVRRALARAHGYAD